MHAPQHIADKRAAVLALFEVEAGADSVDELLGAGYGERLVESLAPLQPLKQKKLEAYIASHVPAPQEQRRLKARALRVTARA